MWINLLVMLKAVLAEFLIGLPSGSCTIKLFTVVIHFILYLIGAFFLFKHFHPSLMIVRKDGAYPSVAPYKTRKFYSSDPSLIGLNPTLKETAIYQAQFDVIADNSNYAESLLRWQPEFANYCMITLDREHCWKGKHTIVHMISFFSNYHEQYS